MTKRYLIVMEATSTGYSAYSPDLPGCVATGIDGVGGRDRGCARRSNSTSPASANRATPFQNRRVLPRTSRSLLDPKRIHFLTRAWS